MTAPDIVTEARQLLDAATPGPWGVSPNDEQLVVAPRGRRLMYVGESDEPADAALIAAAPRLVTELVAEVERLRAALDQRTDPELADETQADDELMAALEEAADPLRTPDEWQPIVDVVIYDPDGWRMDDKPWDEPITEAEFRRRAMHSTVKPGPRFMRETRDAAARLLGGDPPAEAPAPILRHGVFVRENNGVWESYIDGNYIADHASESEAWAALGFDSPPAARLRAELDQRTDPELAEGFVCDRCGYGSSDTDDIDWDVMYGHERCKNPLCPKYRGGNQ